MRWLDPTPRARMTGTQQLPGRRNYLFGADPQKWITGVPTFSGVQYHDLYPRTDLVFHGGQRDMEYDWIVRPGGNPGAIRMRFGGIRGQRLDENGDLVLETAAGEIRQHKPVVFQDIKGYRKQIGGRYLIGENRVVRFEVGRYDPRIDLVIDPVIVYAALLGGTATADLGTAIAVDSAGNTYVAGTASAADFPQVNPVQTEIGNTFVFKLDPSGSTLIYSTYIGGLGAGGGPNTGTGNTTGLAVDSSGSAIIVGGTFGDLPIANAFQPQYGGRDTSGANTQGDAFVTKLNPAGDGLVFSTYLGGSRGDGAASVALDASGNIYVTGTTNSKDFPVTTGVLQGALPTPSGPCANAVCTNAFVSKLSPQGALIYSTYLGGSQGGTWGAGIAVDASGNAYVTGKTEDASFPVTPNAFQGSCAGCNSYFRAFVSKEALRNKRFTVVAESHSSIRHETRRAGG